MWSTQFGTDPLKICKQKKTEIGCNMQLWLQLQLGASLLHSCYYTTYKREKYSKQLAIQRTESNKHILDIHICCWWHHYIFVLIDVTQNIDAKKNLSPTIPTKNIGFICKGLGSRMTDVQNLLESKN